MGGGYFQDVVGAAGVSARVGGDFAQTFLRCFEMHLAEAALGIVECATQKNNDLIFSQWVQHINAAAREKGRVDFEGWIFGGGADQADAAFFHVREEGILLRFVEAVNFVDEDNGARAVLAGGGGLAPDLLDFLDAGEDGGKTDEVGPGVWGK